MNSTYYHRRSDLSQEEILQLLLSESLPNFETVVLGDELLKRKLPIENLDHHFESYFKKLSVSQLRELEFVDLNLSQASQLVICKELLSRRQQVVEWRFFRNEEVSEGMNRMELQEHLKVLGITDWLNSFIWKEGYKDWIKLSDLENFSPEVFYDQIENARVISFNEESRQKSDARPAKEKKHHKSTGAANVFFGIQQLFAIPWWVIMLIIALGTGYDSVAGTFFPSAFSIFMIALSIPLAIGFFFGKPWAYGLKIISGVFLLSWVGLRIALDDGGIFWKAVVFFELILLIMVFSLRPKKATFQT